MSHLSLKLKEILAENRKGPRVTVAATMGKKKARVSTERGPRTASDVARASGLPNSNLSRILRGMGRFISREDMAQLAAGMSKEPEVQAQIIAAHMMDSCHGPGSDLIEVSVKGVEASPNGEGKGRKKVTMTKRFSPAGEEALEYLRDLSPGNPSIEAHLITTARLLGMDKKRRR